MKTNQEIRKAILESTSIAEVLRKLDLKSAGGNYRTLKQKIKDLQIDTSHFLGQAHLRGKTYVSSLKLPINEILTENSKYQSYKLKNRLIETGILLNKCSECDLKEEWQGKRINHQLDHINGNNTDNRLENLRLLCPNCHSQTSNYAGRNKGKL